MAALLRHSEKELKEIDKLSGVTKKRKNKKPEKLVEAECLLWMRQRKFSVQIIEAKATYDPRRGVWRNQAVTAGTFDCVGDLPSGIGCYVEFKAPGKLSTFNKQKNHRQIEYAKEKIKSNCFVAVVDSVDRLKEIYEHWETLKGTPSAQAYLLEMLP